MATRKCRNIHFPKYFMAVRKFINIYIPKYFCTSVSIKAVVNRKYLRIPVFHQFR